MADSPELALETALSFALEKLGFTFLLKEKQIQAIKSILSRRDTLVVLPTGYGKSLVYQCLPLAFDNLNSRINTSRNVKSAVLIVSPLNSLMLDQVAKLKKKGMEVSIWKADEVGLNRYQFTTKPELAYSVE